MWSWDLLLISFVLLGSHVSCTCSHPGMLWCVSRSRLLFTCTQTYTHTYTEAHTLPVREPEKAVYAPLRYCQIAQATRAGEDPKDLLVHFLTQLIVLLHGHTCTTISAQAWSSSDRPSSVQILLLAYLNVGTQISVKPFRQLSTF